MYAQCPECLTFFRVRPEQLKAAHGKVRCSQCKHVFNALETLRGDLTAEELRAVREARRTNESADTPAASREENGDLFASLDYTKNEELPLGSGDEETPQLDEEAAADEVIDENEPDIGARAAELAEFDEENREQLESRTGLTEQMGDDFGELPRTDFTPRRKRRHPAMSALLFLVNVLLLAVLAAQVVHHERRELLAHPEIGPYLAEAYARIEFDVAPPRELGAIRVVRTNVATHPEYSSTLLLTAVMENRAEFAQPWPLLRIDLQDRWGDTVGARYFTPAEYLKDPSKAADLMPMTDPQAVALAISDPGPDAVGFQVEPCMEQRNRKVCASDLR